MFKYTIIIGGSRGERIDKFRPAEGHKTVLVTWLSTGWGHTTAWAVYGQHLLDNQGQARPDPAHTETGELIQKCVSQCPPYSGQMTCVDLDVCVIISN